MASPLTTATSPASAASAVGGPGGAPPDTDTELDAGNADEGSEPEVIATICVNKDGTYTLYAGDELESMEGDAAAPGAGVGDEAAPEGKNFDTPQALMRGVMELLNPTAGAEDSFGKGFRGEADAAPAEAPPPAPGM